MTPRPPKPLPAALYELSQMTRAVVYGRGSVILIRGKDATTLSDCEAAKLVAAHTAFAGPAHDPVVRPDEP